MTNVASISTSTNLTSSPMTTGVNRTSEIARKAYDLRIDFTKSGWRQFAKVNRTLGSRFLKAFILQHELALYIANYEADGYRLDTICQEVRFDDNVYLLLKRCQGVWLITDVGLISETLVDERSQVSGEAGKAGRTTTWTYFPFWVWQRITTGLRTVLRQVLCGWGCKPEHA